MSKKPYFHLADVIEQVSDLRENGISRGELCGLSSLDDIFTLKKGYPLFIAGAPYSGKTEFILEVLLNTSILYGWKHYIYVGEGGDVQQVFGELIHKYAQKPITKENSYCMDDKEFIHAKAFVMKHFIIANHDNEFTISDFYISAQEAEIEYNIRFDTTLFDPFNDVKDEVGEFGGREDKYLATALKIVRVDSKKNNRINILVNHIADVRAVTDSSGNRYMPPALPNEWAGGRTWWRRAFTMLLVYRPPTFLNNENGLPFQENETQIIVQKSKPKGIGRIGKASIFWDWKKNRYYCFSKNNQKLYSCETEQTIKNEEQFRSLANKEFLRESNNEDDMPF